ncbi:MAG TPA: CmcJ/NvfI family oxidoreductase [Candidatus Binataceae bacterium]|nr:CmcJ/NvfI family oxidoreductase [Candidatus Binataceae bacterium]
MASSATAIDRTGSLPSIEGSLNYLGAMDERPVTYAYPPPPGTPENNLRSEAHRMPISDGRPIANKLSLDEQGFELLRHETAVKDFYDPEQVRSVYYPEVIELLKQATGAEKVVIFDHTLRRAGSSKQQIEGVKEPVQSAHNDYTLTSGPQRVQELLPADEAAERLTHRYTEVNVWRPISGPVMEWPLAVCDARTMTQKDFVATYRLYPDRTGEIYTITYSPNHRWYYFPQMERNEVVLLKGYDSLSDGRARFTGHTSFADPTTPPGAPPRESIEVRALLFFAPEKH